MGRSKTLVIPQSRVEILAEALGKAVPQQGDVQNSLNTLVDDRNLEQIWLAIAVLSGRYPTPQQVIETYR